MFRRLAFFAITATALLLPATPSRAQAMIDLDSIHRRLMPLPKPIPGPHPGPGWVWIPPTYRTVYDRVWRDGSYQTVRERVWVPDQHGWRTVCYWDGTRYVERQEWGVTVPGHYETRTHQVYVPGGWTSVPRHELVSPGRWEWHGPGPMPPPQPVPLPHPVPPSPATRPPGLEPFSPLWEWPAEKK